LQTISRYLYDNLDREYERKNLYLKEIATLQQEIKEASKEEKAELNKKLQEIKKDKSNNRYIKRLNEFEEKEKIFLKNLEEKSKTIKNNHGTSIKKVDELEV
jgi:arabinogalactan oligomer / maltooligosaccharide transport system permease protein